MAFFRWLWMGSLATLMILFFPGKSLAQWFRLGGWEGAYESLTEFSREDTKTGGSSPIHFQDILEKNQLTLRNVGAYILDPQLVTLTLGGTFGLSDDWFSTDGTRDTRRGTLWGYDFFSGILSEKPFSLNLFANRNQSSELAALAGRVDVTSQNRGATLFARRLYVPSTLTFRQEIQDQESRSSGIVDRTSTRRNILTYDGERGWVDSEMSVRYELIDLSDEIFPDLSYRSQEGNLSYSLDFGEELNRRWDSRLRFLTRTGLSNLTTLSVDEALQIDHSERLRTNYRYYFTRIDTSGGATTSHTATFSLLHRLYQSLTTNFSLNGSLQSIPEGSHYLFSGLLDFAYTKKIPWEGQLNIGLGGGLQYDDSRFRSTESFVPQETHSAGSPFALPIALTNPFVEPDSIVVTKIALGPTPPGCVAPPGPPTPLVLGRDYTVQAFGDLTEIVPIPCAGITPGINPGDTIAVDYRFSVSPSLKFLTDTLHTNVSVDYRWIRPYFMHEQTNEHLLAGQDSSFLDNRRSDTLGTELRYDGQRLRASLLGEGQIFTSRRIAYDAARSNQFMAYSIRPDLMLTLNADQALFSYSEPKRQTRTFGARATLSYTLNATLFADGFAAVRDLMDSTVPNERITEAGVRAQWFFRNVTILPSLGFIDRRRGDTDTKEYRLRLDLIRRF